MKNFGNRMLKPKNREGDETHKDTQAPAKEEPRKPACPYCGLRKSTVRSTQGTYRYRHCTACGRSFTTIESTKKEA